jgi:nitronate monooxygenase
VASNTVSREVIEILDRGGQFEDIRDLVAGVRGRTVFEHGDLEAGVWTVGTAMGLIDDIPTVAELVSRIVAEADELITERLSDMIEPSEVHPLALPVELELNRSIS